MPLAGTQSTLSLISDAAKKGATVLETLFVENPETFLETIRWLAPIDSERWQQPLTSTITTAVSNHISSLDVSVRWQACEIILKHVTEGDSAESLALLSNLLLSMRPQDDGNDDGLVSLGDHSKYEQYSFNELKRCRWTGTKLVRILYFLRDIDLKSDMLDSIVFNFHNGIMDSEASNIPSACYNFIYLSDKFPGQCMTILKVFVSSCEALTTRAQTSPPETRMRMLHGLSTAIQSFSFSAKQDQQLPDCLMKLLKFRLVQFGPFILALVLSFLDSNRYQKQINAYLSTYALDSYRYKLAKPNSKFVVWTIQQLQKSSKNATDNNEIGLYQDFDQVIDAVVEHCESGWESFIPNLVDVCFLLLGHYDKSCRSGHVLEIFNKKHLNPKLLAVRAGLRSLLSIFASYPASRASIIERIFQCISCSEEHESDSDLSESLGSGHMSPAMVLLDQLMARSQVVFFDMIPQIRNCFDHLMDMSSRHSCQLIRVLVPVITKRKELNDALSIIIRKNMFSRHLHQRIMAVEIMLTLVHSISGVQTSLSQMSQSSSSTTMLSSSDAQCFMEFKGLLHRVLSQQPQIRAHTYGCLQRCFQTGSPSLRRCIFQLLKKQLTTVLEPESCEKLPFWVDACIQSATVIEPLPALFYHFCQCLLLLKISGSPGMQALFEDGSKLIDSVLEKLGKCNLEDFAFEKADSMNRSQMASALSSSSDVVVRENLRLSSLLWLEIHETAMGYLLMIHDRINVETAEQVLKLHKTWEQLKPTASAKLTNKRKSPDVPMKKLPYFGVKACRLVLGIIDGHFEGDPSNCSPPTAVVELLRGNSNFIQFCIISVATDIELSFSAIRSPMQRDLFVAMCCSFCPALFRQCLRDIASAKEHNSGSSAQRASGKFKAFHSLELFYQVLNNITVFGSEAVRDFYRSASLHELAIFEERRELDPDDPSLFLESLEYLFMQTCSNRDVIMPNAANTIISILALCIPFFSDENNARSDWLAEVYRFNVSVPTLSSNLLSYGFQLLDLRSSLKLFSRVAQDSVFSMGDIGEDIQPTASTEMGFICETTVPTVISRLLQLIESEFHFAEWLLSAIKLVASHRKDQDAARIPEDANPFSAERAHVCLDCISFLLFRSFEVLHELLKIRSKDPIIFKNVLSFLIRAFKFAINVVGTLTLMKRPPSRRFADLVAWVGSSVNPAIYSLVKYNQEADLGAQRQSKSATKKRIDGEKKLLPELTNQMEKFEHCCRRYSKIFKEMQIDSYFTRATAFDFRFSVAKALGEGSGSEKKKKKRSEDQQKHEPQEPDSQNEDNPMEEIGSEENLTVDAEE